VIRVEIPWRDRRDGAQFSIELSNWCSEQELIKNVDFWWHFIPDQKVTVFYFDDRVESYATVFTLRWAGHEV
jgi:hypothetical protein